MALGGGSIYTPKKKGHPHLVICRAYMTKIYIYILRYTVSSFHDGKKNPYFRMGRNSYLHPQKIGTWTFSSWFSPSKLPCHHGSRAPRVPVDHYLLGGWTNPSEKYYIVKMGSSSPRIGMKIKHLWVATTYERARFLTSMDRSHINRMAHRIYWSHISGADLTSSQWHTAGNQVRFSELGNTNVYNSLAICYSRI